MDIVLDIGKGIVNDLHIATDVVEDLDAPITPEEEALLDRLFVCSPEGQRQLVARILNHE